MTTVFDPALDLVLERIVDVPPRLVWQAWTIPAHLKEWFTPRPWTVTSCEIDLRPGGLFKTVMCSPDGQEFPNHGCYLEIVQEKRLVWTDALTAGFRPAAKSFMTAIITLEPHEAGTKYSAIALHSDEATRQQHEEMGFLRGWGSALDQLVAHAKRAMT